MKHLKQRLIAATAMLMVSAVMLTSVSYAWFTMSTNPEITGMTATVTANENLEIALDNWYYAGEANGKAENENGGQISVDEASIYNNQPGVQGSTVDNPYTWGNLVDLSMAFNTLNGIETPTDDAATISTLNIQPMKFINQGTDIPNPEYVIPIIPETAEGGTEIKDAQDNTWTKDETSGTYTRIVEDEPTDGATEATTGTKYTYTPAVEETEASLKKVAVTKSGESWEDATEATEEEVPKEIKAPTAILQYPEYNKDGRVSLLKDAAATLFSAHGSFVDAYKNGVASEEDNAIKGGVKAYSANQGKANYYAFSVDYWIRSNVSGNVYLSKDAALRANDETTAQNPENGYKEDVINTIKGNGSYIKIPAASYGVVKYEYDTENQTFTPLYTEEQLAINAYIKNLVVRFEYITTAEDENGEIVETAHYTDAAFAAVPDYMAGSGIIQPILKDGFVITEGEGENATTKMAEGLVKHEVTIPAEEGGTAATVTYYYLNAKTKDDNGNTAVDLGDDGKGEATLATENLQDLYIYLDNAPALENGTEKVDSDGNKIYTPVVTLKRNIGQKVTMYVFLDGETVSNADALLSDLGGLQFNIQFTHETIGDGTGIDGGAQPVDPRPEENPAPAPDPQP